MFEPERLLEKVKEPRVYRSLVFLGLVAAAIFYFKSLVVTAALIVGVAVVSWSMNQMGLKAIGIELATLSTVLIGATYGPVTGAVAGLGLIMLQVIAGQYTGGYIVWVIPSYAVAGFVAGVFSGMEITTLGIGLTVVMQSVFAALTSLSAAGNFGRYFPYAATNIVFNIALFIYLAPFLTGLM